MTQRNLELGTLKTEARPGPGDKQEVHRHPGDTPGVQVCNARSQFLASSPPLKPPRAGLGISCPFQALSQADSGCKNPGAIFLQTLARPRRP